MSTHYSKQLTRRSEVSKLAGIVVEKRPERSGVRIATESATTVNASNKVSLQNKNHH